MFWISMLIALTSSSTTHPADTTIDDILAISHPSTAPTTFVTTAPTTQPLQLTRPDPDARHGTIILSDGQRIEGSISTTPGQPLRVWDESAGEFRDLPLRSIASITAEVLWEKDETEWRFAQSGSDIKIESRQTYPARETAYRFTLLDHTIITGSIAAPLFITTGDQSQTCILHKRDKGKPGQTLDDLKYVKEVNLR